MSANTSSTFRKLYKVFVYGTLRQGEPNHNLIQDPTNGYARFVAKAKTSKKYPLVIASKFNIPFLLSHEGVGHQILGEIYEIDTPMLAVLDKLENHPDYYTRREEPIEIAVEPQSTTATSTNGQQQQERKIEQCWMYFLCQYQQHLLSLPYLESYSSKGEHNLPYVESDDITDAHEIFTRR